MPDRALASIIFLRNLPIVRNHFLIGMTHSRTIDFRITIVPITKGTRVLVVTDTRYQRFKVLKHGARQYLRFFAMHVINVENIARNIVDSIHRYFHFIAIVNYLILHSINKSRSK